MGRLQSPSPWGKQKSLPLDHRHLCVHVAHTHVRTIFMRKSIYICPHVRVRMYVLHKVNTEFRVGNFAVDLNREISHAKLKCHEIPPPYFVGRGGGLFSKHVLLGRSGACFPSHHWPLGCPFTKTLSSEPLSRTPPRRWDTPCHTGTGLQSNRNQTKTLFGDVAMGAFRCDKRSTRRAVFLRAHSHDT